MTEALRIEKAFLHVELRGTVHRMKTTLDAEGRLQIPAQVLTLSGLRPGDGVEVRWRDGHIEVEPESADEAGLDDSAVELVQKGHLLVAVAKVPGEPLTLEMVEDIRDEIERERAGLQ